jgi:hypothetical protein
MLNNPELNNYVESVAFNKNSQVDLSAFSIWGAGPPSQVIYVVEGRYCWRSQRK